MATKVEAEVHESSLDNSGDGELLGMVDESSFERVQYKNGLTQSLLDTGEEDSNSYPFKDLSGGVTYRFVPMTSGEETINDQTSGPVHVLPAAEYYVIGDSVEVFGAQTSQKKTNMREAIQTKVITTKKRDDKRRATHNEVERRRRDKINSWITKLALLIPNTGLPDSASKGGILAKACEYITELTEQQKRAEKLEIDNDRLVKEILRLNHEISDLRKENTTLRSQIVDNSILPQKSKVQKS